MERKVYWAAGSSVFTAIIVVIDGGGFHKRPETVQEVSSFGTPEDARQASYRLNFALYGEVIA